LTAIEQIENQCVTVSESVQEGDTGLVLDLMELDDKTTPSAVVEEIIRQNPHLSFPTPLEQLAELAGIESINELSTDGFEGMLITNAEKSRGAIFVKAGVMSRRRRFTIAHELGHFLLPWHRQERFSCKSTDIRINTDKASEEVWSQQQIEVEANRFASELLMPQVEVERILDDQDVPELIDLVDLSEMFDVSVEAVVHRYKILSPYPLAFVFSYNNVVRYWVKSTSMPYSLKVRKDQPLPLRSPSRLAGEYISDWDTVAAHVWLEVHAALSLPRQVMEQTLYQSAGYKLTMLTLGQWSPKQQIFTAVS